MTAMTTATKDVTADELLKMGDIGRCELIYGELVMMSPAGAEHGVIAARFSFHLWHFVGPRKLGMVFGAETGFKLAAEPDLVRAPDASFVRSSRIGKKLPKGYFSGAPDLAIEVVSPDDTRREVAEKVNAWLAHGAASVWVADPKPMSTTVHRTGVEPVVFRLDQTLTDESVLPGLSIEMSDIFSLVG
jgi:Uma2 family endonuclease